MKGYKKISRTTKQKAVIVDVLKRTRTHPSAAEVYLLVRKKIPNVSLGTVYRNLELMSAEGRILKISCGPFSRYDGFTHAHSHFICEKCQKAFDIEPAIKTTFNKSRFERKMHFVVKRIDVEVRGLCKNCSM